MSDEYQPRTPERLIEILRSEGRNPRAWQSEAADTIERLHEALKFARKRLVYYGTISDRRHFDHDLAEVYPKIDAALHSISQQVTKP